MTIAATTVRVEDKLFQNRYLVDAGRPHIKVRPHETPSANLLALTRVCPAKCYEETDTGQVEISADGCMECGTCPRPVRSLGRDRVGLSARRFRRPVQVRLTLRPGSRDPRTDRVDGRRPSFLCPEPWRRRVAPRRLCPSAAVVPYAVPPPAATAISRDLCRLCKARQQREMIDKPREAPKLPEQKSRENSLGGFGPWKHPLNGVSKR